MRSDVAERVGKIEETVYGNDGLLVKVSEIHNKVKNIPGFWTLMGYVLTFCGVLGTGMFFLLKNQQVAVTADMKLFVMQQFADDNSSDTTASVDVKVAGIK